ncbi:MAG: YraN family protein [Candidatus Gracilibacteria bacterium]|nr:YraN family protein [Candidatus Gracilibacteria bacterium]
MKKSGDKAEILAIEYLKRNGYILIETNFKFSIFGEIDLICQLGDLTVFVEVKYRSSEKFGTGEESITNSKLFKLEKSIYYYCNGHNLNIEKIRFDVISITKQEKSYKLIHYKNQKLI